MSARINSEIISVTWSENFAAHLKDTIENDPSYKDDLFEYTIKMNEDGTPVDGDPSTSEIDPVVDTGARDHIPPELWEKYKKTRKKTSFMEKVLPQLAPLF